MNPGTPSILLPRRAWSTVDLQCPSSSLYCSCADLTTHWPQQLNQVQAVSCPFLLHQLKAERGILPFLPSSAPISFLSHRRPASRAAHSRTRKQEEAIDYSTSPLRSCLRWRLASSRPSPLSSPSPSSPYPLPRGRPTTRGTRSTRCGSGCRTPTACCRAGIPRSSPPALGSTSHATRSAASSACEFFFPSFLPFFIQTSLGGRSITKNTKFLISLTCILLRTR